MNKNVTVLEDKSVEPYFDRDSTRWERILEHGDFHEALELFDAVFSDEGIEVKTHLGVNAVNDVRYENFSVPRTLDLMIADSYEEFMDEVSNSFFQGMERSDYRRPPNSNIEIGFGSYSEVFELDAGFESLKVAVPSDQSFNEEVLSSFYDENGFEGVSAAVTHESVYDESSGLYMDEL